MEALRSGEDRQGQRLKTELSGHFLQNNQSPRVPSCTLHRQRTTPFPSQLRLLSQNTLDWSASMANIYLSVLEAGKPKIKVWPLHGPVADGYLLALSSHARREGGSLIL